MHKYFFTKLFYFNLSALVCLTVGCTRPMAGSVQVSLVMPNHPDIVMKSLNQLLPDASPRVCYIVNLVAPDLPSVPKQCFPPKGQVSAFLDPKSTAVFDVKKGKDRTFELYAYVTAQNETCAQLTDLQKVDPFRLFAMGSAAHLDVLQDTLNVTIDSHFPGVNSSFAVKANLADVCKPYATPGNLATADFNGGPSTGKLFKVVGKTNSSFQGLKSKGSIYSAVGVIKNVVQ